MDLLGDIRVVDFSTEIAGPYCTKLLADAGADVVKVEPVGGDPLRQWTASDADRQGHDGALFQYLNTTKRSIVAELRSEKMERLLSGADLIVESGQLADEDLRWLASQFPQLSVVSISPFGRQGPWAERPTSEFVLQAICGSTSGRGTPEREPFYIGGRFGEWVGGVYAAIASVAVVRATRRSGQGDRVDVSICEALCIMTSDYAPLAESLGMPARPVPERHIEVPSIEPTADGLIGFSTVAPQMFSDFLSMIERPDLIGDPVFANATTRHDRRDDFLSMVWQWTTQHNSAEIEEDAVHRRIPVTLVGTPDTVMEMRQFVEEGVFVKNPSGGFLQPRPHYRVDGRAPADFGPVPTLGEHTEVVEWKDQPSTARAASPFASQALPLDGIRVVDMTGYWAGPSATMVLGLLGAEVIKIESARRPDPMRLFSAKAPGEERWWEWGSFFQAVNLNKKSFAVDLARTEGIDLLLGIIERSDVVIENFSPRVLDNFGLTWERIHELNPRALLVRMPAFGLTGPWRDRVGLGQTIEQVSGIAWMTGFADDVPRVPQGACDPLSGMHALYALLATLNERDRSGIGHLIESPMADGALNVAAEMAIEYSAYGASLMRQGNRGPVSAPQGLYPCAGRENWLALAVTTDDQWHALGRVLGSPDWAGDPALASIHDRRQAHDEIDKQLADFFADKEIGWAVEALIGVGVPAGRVTERSASYRNPQFRARGFIETFDHPVVGRHEVGSMPFRLSSNPNGWIRTPSPGLGQHNREILQELLELTDDDIENLTAAGIIGDRLPESSP